MVREASRRRREADGDNACAKVAAAVAAAAGTTGVWSVEGDAVAGAEKESGEKAVLDTVVVEAKAERLLLLLRLGAILLKGDRWGSIGR
jgi:hypothetical protein